MNPFKIGDLVSDGVSKEVYQIESFSSDGTVTLKGVDKGFIVVSPVRFYRNYVIYRPTIRQQIKETSQVIGNLYEKELEAEIKFLEGVVPVSVLLDIKKQKLEKHRKMKELRKEI